MLHSTLPPWPEACLSVCGYRTSSTSNFPFITLSVVSFHPCLPGHISCSNPSRVTKMSDPEGIKQENRGLNKLNSVWNMYGFSQKISLSAFIQQPQSLCE